MYYFVLHPKHDFDKAQIAKSCKVVTIHAIVGTDYKEKDRDVEMFTAAVLTDNSADLLKWIMRGTLNLEEEGFVLKTMAGQDLPHHMTINLGPLDETLNPREVLGADVLLEINCLVYCHKLGVCASPVIGQLVLDVPGCESLQLINEQPHITVCVRPPAKPKMSNDLFKKQAVTYKLDKSYYLDAKIQEC